MNKPVSLPKLSKANLSSLKLPKGITSAQLLLMAVGVILLGVTIYFVISYFSAVNNKKDLDHDITQKQQQINNLGSLQNIGALQSQLEEALQDLIDKSPFPETIANTDVAYSIIQAAREASITCFRYDPQDADTTVSINNNEYIDNRYSVSSSGAGDTGGEKMTRITNFLENLEAAYDTARISGITLTDSEGDDLWTFSCTYSIISLYTE